MAYLQQFKNDLKSVEEKLTQELFHLKSSFQEVKLEIKEIKSSFQEFQKVLKNLNQVLVLQSQQLQTSALPSNPSLLPHQAEPSATRSFRLQLKGESPEKLFTNSKLEDEGFSLALELCHDTGERVCPEPWMKDLKVEYSVIKGEFTVEERHDWTVEDYNNHVVTPREGKPALLKGKCKVSLSEGSARVCELSITDNSRNGFRLGAQVIGGLPSRWIVRPAVSKAFRVYEDRSKAGQKHPAPSPADELYRLKNIGKIGPIYEKAKQNNIITVMDFLQLYHTDATAMEQIFGSNGKKWKDTVKNAEACILTNERYKYRYHDDASGDVLLLKCDFNIESVTFNGQTSQPYESLDEFQKEKVDILRKAAYKKRKELIKEYEPFNQAQVQPGIVYSSSVEQPPHKKEQQPWSSALQPLPFAPPPSNMDPNVLDFSDQRQICSKTFKSSYLRTTAADHESCQRDIMNASESLITGECEVHTTDMGVGNSSSVAYGFPAEQVADNGLDSLQFPDITFANLDDMSMPQFLDELASSPILIPLCNNGFEDFAQDSQNITDNDQTHTQEEIRELSRKWCQLRLVPLVICRWKRRKAIHSRPQKKQKI